MKNKSIVILLASTFLFAACDQIPATVQPKEDIATVESQVTIAADQPNQELKGIISVSGAFALYPMMTRWAEEFQKTYPGVQFDISAGGAGKGMTDALSGAVDIGMVSRAIKAEEEAKGAYWIPVTKDAVFPVINIKNPALAELRKKGIGQEVFRKIYITGEITTWGEVIGKPENIDKIHIYTRSDACGAAEEWAKFIGGLQEDLLGIGVNADPGLLEAVRNDPLGIGYNNLGYAFELSSGMVVDGAFVVPIDINNNGVADTDEIADNQASAVNLIATGKYPSPPARDLNLVTNGKPDGLVQIFLEWILSDGQKIVNEAGYVKLPEAKLLSAMEKIK
jgi:phosphate transport system substrate-binding protein